MSSFLRTSVVLCYLAALCSASRHTCDSTDACPTTITCTPGEPCSVICSGELSCLSRVINCPSNRECDVHCIHPTDKLLCSEMIINAQNSRSLTVNVATGDSSVTKTMHNAKIHCPSNGAFTHGPVCGINCDGDDLMANTEIYAAEGFDDVVIIATHYADDWCYREGIMHCGNDFSSSCAMTNDPTFQCQPDAADHTCDAITSTRATPTVSPTKTPTTPSTSQSTTPTLIRTADPSAGPTAYPSIEPTSATVASTNTPTRINGSGVIYGVTKEKTDTLSPLSPTISYHYDHIEPKSEEGSVPLWGVILLAIFGALWMCCIVACVCAVIIRLWCKGWCEPDTRKKSKKNSASQRTPKTSVFQSIPVGARLSVKPIECAGLDTGDHSASEQSPNLGDVSDLDTGDMETDTATLKVHVPRESKATRHLVAEDSVTVDQETPELTYTTLTRHEYLLAHRELKGSEGSSCAGR